MVLSTLSKKEEKCSSGKDVSRHNISTPKKKNTYSSILASEFIFIAISATAFLVSAIVTLTPICRSTIIVLLKPPSVVLTSVFWRVLISSRTAPCSVSIPSSSTIVCPVTIIISAISLEGFLIATSSVTMYRLFHYQAIVLITYWIQFSILSVFFL